MAFELSTEHQKIHQKLRATIAAKAKRNELRLEYYDMKHELENFGSAVPDDMKELEIVSGWASKGVNVPTDRIRRTGFNSLSKDNTALLEELQAADATMRLARAETLARHSAALFSCAFVFFTEGDTTKGEPEVIISVKDARYASAIVDPRSGRVTAALEVVDSRTHILYLPHMTVTLSSAGMSRWMVEDVVATGTERVRCTPYRWREELARPFGYSRINRAVMAIIDRAVRAMFRQEGNADFYSSPRGVLEDANQSAFFDAKGKRISPMRAIGSVWGIPGYRDVETGDMRVPKFTQLAQASFQPHSEMIRSIAMNFHSETDIPLGQLGVVQDNPSSADAIRASEHGLLALCVAQTEQFSYASMDSAFNLLSVLNPKSDSKVLADSLSTIRPKFANPATITPNSQADAGSKFVNAFPDLANTDIAMERFGLDAEEIARARAHLDSRGSRSLLEQALEAARANPAQTATETQAKTLHPLEELKLKAEILGQMRRAGVTSESATKAVELEGLDFVPGNPVTIREETP